LVVSTCAGAVVSATGTFKVTGATGAYKRASGKGTLRCSTTDAGKTYGCTVAGTLVR
jgi:hypothetical protein